MNYVVQPGKCNLSFMYFDVFVNAYLVKEFCLNDQTYEAKFASLSGGFKD